MTTNMFMMIIIIFIIVLIDPRPRVTRAQGPERRCTRQAKKGDGKWRMLNVCKVRCEFPKMGQMTRSRRGTTVVFYKDE